MLSTTGAPQQVSTGAEGGAYRKEALIPSAQSPAQPFGSFEAASNPAAALVNSLLGGLGAGGAALGFPALPILPPLQLQNLSYNAVEGKAGLHLTIDAPGVKKEGFSIQVLPPSVEGGPSSLLVRVSRGGVSTSGDYNTFREERWSGQASRNFPLPAWVDPDQIRIEGLCHGVLSIFAPRHASAAAFPAVRYLSFA